MVEDKAFDPANVALFGGKREMPATPEVVGFIEQAAADYGEGWRVPHNPPDADRRTDFLLKAGKEALVVNNPEARQLEHTFVQFTDKADDDFTKPIMAKIAAKVREAGWDYREMPFEHWPLIDKSQEVASLLLELGQCGNSFDYRFRLWTVARACRQKMAQAVQQ